MARAIQAGKHGASAGFVFLEPALDVDRDAGVEAAIDTLEDIDKPGRRLGQT